MEWKRPNNKQEDQIGKEMEKWNGIEMENQKFVYQFRRKTGLSRLLRIIYEF